MSETPTMTPAQARALEAAKDVHDLGILWIPETIGEHSAARALVRRGVLFAVNGVRHEETGQECRGYGVVGLTYPYMKLAH